MKKSFLFLLIISIIFISSACSSSSSSSGNDANDVTNGNTSDDDSENYEESEDDTNGSNNYDSNSGISDNSNEENSSENSYIPVSSISSNVDNITLSYNGDATKISGEVVLWVSPSNATNKNIKIIDDYDSDLISADISNIDDEGRARLSVNLNSNVNTDGSTSIRVYSEDNYSSNKTIGVYVTSNIIYPTSVSLLETSKIVYLGEKAVTLDYEISPPDANDKSVTWLSSNPEIVEVDEYSGEITAVSEGIAAITATTVNGKTATCYITVKKISVESVEFTLGGASCSTDGTSHICEYSIDNQNITINLADNITIKPDNATNKEVSYKLDINDHEDYVSLDGNNLIIQKDENLTDDYTFSVKATSKDNENISSILQILVLSDFIHVDSITTTADNDGIKIIINDTSEQFFIYKVQGECNASGCKTPSNTDVKITLDNDIIKYDHNKEEQKVIITKGILPGTAILTITPNYERTDGQEHPKAEVKVIVDYDSELDFDDNVISAFVDEVKKQINRSNIENDILDENIATIYKTLLSYAGGSISEKSIARAYGIFLVKTLGITYEDIVTDNFQENLINWINTEDSSVINKLKDIIEKENELKTFHESVKSELHDNDTEVFIFKELSYYSDRARILKSNIDSWKSSSTVPTVATTKSNFKNYAQYYLNIGDNLTSYIDKYYPDYDNKAQLEEWYDVATQNKENVSATGSSTRGHVVGYFVKVHDNITNIIKDVYNGIGINDYLQEHNTKLDDIISNTDDLISKIYYAYNQGSINRDNYYNDIVDAYNICATDNETIFAIYNSLAKELDDNGAINLYYYIISSSLMDNIPYEKEEDIDNIVKDLITKLTIAKLNQETYEFDEEYVIDEEVIE